MIGKKTRSNKAKKRVSYGSRSKISSGAKFRGGKVNNKSKRTRKVRSNKGKKTGPYRTSVTRSKRRLRGGSEPPDIDNVIQEINIELNDTALGIQYFKESIEGLKEDLSDLQIDVKERDLNLSNVIEGDQTMTYGELLTDLKNLILQQKSKLKILIQKKIQLEAELEKLKKKNN